MYIQRKRVIAAAIATLLAAPAWTTSVSADDPASSLTGLQSQSDASGNSDAGRASGPGTSASTGTATQGAGTGSTQQWTGSGPNSGTTGDDARSTTGLSAAGRSTTPTTSMGSGRTAQMAANPLYGRSVDELTGTDIVNAAGEKIGDVKEVVLSQGGRDAHAVIGVGGFLGTGERDIAVSLEELQTGEGNELRLSATKDQLEARPQYRAEQYSRLEGNQAISGSITDFAAFETDRSSSTGTDRGSNVEQTMDKDTSLRSTGTGTSTGSDASRGTDAATGGAATGSGSSTTNK